MATQLFIDTILGEDPKEEDIIKIMGMEDFDPNYTDPENGVTLLHVLCDKNMPKAIGILLDKGVDINVKCIKYGMTPLHNVVGMGFHESALVLLERGADVNSILDTGCNFITPLRVGISGNDKRVVKLLLLFGADINSRYTKSKQYHWYNRSGGIIEMVRWHEIKLWSDFFTLV